MSAAEAPRVVEYPPPAHRFLTPGLIALYLAEDPAQSVLETGTDPGGGDWDDLPPKSYESNFFHYDFVQLGKQRSWYKAHLDVHCFVTVVLWSILHVSYGSELVMRRDCKTLLKSPPVNVPAGSAPALKWIIWSIAGTCQRSHLRDKLGLGTMKAKGYSNFTTNCRTPELQSRQWLQFSVLSGIERILDMIQF